MPGMTRLLPLAAAFAVATSARAQPVVAPVPSVDMQPGYGVVESVTEVRVRERSAAAGASSPGEREEMPVRPAYRVVVRMGDGSLQRRDLERPEFRPGDRVLLTNAGDVLPD